MGNMAMQLTLRSSALSLVTHCISLALPLLPTHAASRPRRQTLLTDLAAFGPHLPRMAPRHQQKGGHNGTLALIKTSCLHPLRGWRVHGGVMCASFGWIGKMI